MSFARAATSECTFHAEAGAWVGYLGSAAVFVSIHIPGYLLAMNVPPLEIAQRSASIFGLALVLGFLLQKSGSIYAPLLVHAANNFAAAVFWK